MRSFAPRPAAALLHFCDGPVVLHALSRVARPGSLALAPLAAGGATLIAPHRAPRAPVPFRR
jgi:hypothetical protein